MTVTVTIAPQFTQRNHRWTAWKAVHTLKRGVFQHEENESMVTVWFYDKIEVHLCTMWKTALPHTLLEVYSQEQNDADLADWEANYKPRSNGALEIVTEDGRTMVQPVTLDRGLWHYITGVSDHPTNGRGQGPEFTFSMAAEGTEQVEIQMNDWVELAAGTIIWEGAKIGDWVRLEMVFPATTGTSTPGTGNANKYPIGGGLHMFVPAAGDGDWTLDLDSMDVCPVLTNQDRPEGFWDWSWPDEGIGEMTPNLIQQGYYNLFDFPIDPAVVIIPKLHMLGSHMRAIPETAPHPTDVLPHHHMRASVHHGSGTHQLDVVFDFEMARKKST